MLTQKTLKELLYYDLNTGVFTWRVDRGGKVKVGRVVGWIDQGYIRMEILGATYLAHRLAFLYVEGEFPSHEVDHKNNVRSDNRWHNLRKCLHIENTYNRSLRSNNTSGIKGVSWHKAINKWQVAISANKKRYYLGVFEDLELAEFVASEARDVLHKEFANNG